MTLGYDGKLFILAFDHRGSFQKKFFGVEGAPSPEDTQRIIDAKALIFEGAQKGLAAGVDASSVGILVDEQFGTGVANAAKQQGLMLAMPCEKSGQNEFDFEYGDRFGDKIEEFDPDFSKVLVRYNPEGDPELNKRQIVKLRQLSEWLHERRRKYLFELLVPAEPAQLERVGGSADRYDTELRPELMLEAILQLQNGGVEPDIWKIEGIDDREACREIAHLARREGRDHVSCVVLGRGASDAKVDEWLRAGAGLAGYIGFAIGRSIWWDPLKAFVDGAAEREDAAKQIAANYRRFIDVYTTG